MSDQGPYPGGANPYNPNQNPNPFGRPPNARPPNQPDQQPGYPPGGQQYLPPAAQQYPPDGGQQYGQPVNLPYDQPHGGQQLPYGGVPQYENGPYGNQLPPPKKKKTVWIILGVVAAVAVAAVVAIVVAALRTDDISDVKAGDCVTVTGANLDVDFNKVDCGKTSPLNFIVAEKIDSSSGDCGGEQYPRLSETGVDDPETLCLVPNFQLDKCYSIPISSVTGIKESSCEDSGASQINGTVRITQRVDSTTVPGCSSAITYDKPRALGFCLEPVG